MQNIKIERLENIKKELESLEEDDVLFVDDDNKTAYAIIATGESAVYANVMLQKGVVK